MPSDRRSVVARGALRILILGSGYDRPPGGRAGWRGCHGVPWCAPSVVGGTGLLWSWGLRQGTPRREEAFVPVRQPAAGDHAVEHCRRPGGLACLGVAGGLAQQQRAGCEERVTRSRRFIV